MARKKPLKKKWMQKESVSKQGRKSTKSTPTAHTDQVFDDVDVNDAIDYMETDAYMQKGVSTEDQVSTVKPDEDIDKLKVSTDKPEVSTAKPKEVEVSTDKLDEGTVEPKDGTSMKYWLLNNYAEDSDRPRATLTRLVLTLKPLPKINLKDKGKKVLEEKAKSDAESDGVDKAERKFDQLAKDEEIARKARIEANRLLAARLQEEERETFIVKERAKFLYDTIVAQRRFLAQQRAAAIRSRPPTRTQLRNQMMTYQKHVGGKKHADLKNKNFEEIQVLYKEVKRFDKNFIAIGSAEDERQIKEMNEESKDPRKERELKKSTIDSEIMETKIFVSKFAQGLSSPDWDYLLELEDYEESLTEENDQVKSWLVQDQTVPVQKQTAFGKDKSNPLIVDSLLKTIRLSIHLVVYNEELAILEQTATGKGISNPLMAGSLPKTTKPT
ncbi:hypothetical protein Tco_0855486 [Tanacetum coccineum]